MYKYGMRLRGFSPACQPMNGLIGRDDDLTGRYYDILIYSRPLNDHEQDVYELDYLGEWDEREMQAYLESQEMYDMNGDPVRDFEGNPW